MKEDLSILARFEQLPLLRERMERGNAQVKAGARRKVANLLGLESTFDDIVRTLNVQRIQRDDFDNTQNIRPLDDARREEYMANLRHVIPFFALRAFSLPVDYRVPKRKIENREMYDAFIEAIVIQPEYLSDDFLTSLGLMREEEKDQLSTSEKITRKIELIPKIKDLLKGLSPLQLGEKRTTGRIARVSDTKSPHFGGYVVFQEVSEIERDREKKRRNMRRKVVPKFYKDHYSLIRSQRYATLELSRKVDFLSNIRDDMIPAMLRRWQRVGYGVEEKQKDKATLIAELEGSLAYHERRALEDRIKKIDLKNPEQDRQRLIGACNDIIKAISEKIGKGGEISAQGEFIRNSEKQVRSAFEHFYEEVVIQIPLLNDALKGFDPDSISEEENLKGEQVHQLRAFIRVVERYNEELSRIPEIGSPFNTIKRVVGIFLLRIKEHRNQRKQAIGRLGVRHILSLILELKRIRYEVILKETEHRVKIRGDRMPKRERVHLIGKIEEVRDSLENQRFLPEVTLRARGQESFEEMISELNKLIQNLGNGNDEI